MWLFLSRHLRRWLIVSVAVPAVGAAARGLGSHLEKRKGSTRLSRSLTKAGDLAARRSSKGSSKGSAKGLRRGRKA
ncbi:MAG: hypothetical protein ACT4P1_03090 [Sporichthyaceae bacterium]